MRRQRRLELERVALCMLCTYIAARTSLHVEQLLHAEYVGTNESIDRAHAFGVDFF